MITFVTGFFPVKNKYNIEDYYRWFKNTLNFNANYVFFGPAEVINRVRSLRRYPTHYVECDISEFYTMKHYNDIIIHPVHCPSKELNIVWNEKIFLLQRAAHLNPFGNSTNTPGDQYFMWIDAGLHQYRNRSPSSIPIVLPAGMKIRNKLIYTSTEQYFKKSHVSNDAYYHFVSGNFLCHIDFIDGFVEIYKKYIDTLMPQRGTTYTEQVILTHILRDHPKLFHKAGYGYGRLLSLLRSSSRDLFNFTVNGID